jgi:hypothetical protein
LQACRRLGCCTQPLRTINQHQYFSVCACHKGQHIHCSQSTSHHRNKNVKVGLKVLHISSLKTECESPQPPTHSFLYLASNGPHTETTTRPHAQTEGEKQTRKITSVQPDKLADVKQVETGTTAEARRVLLPLRDVCVIIDGAKNAYNRTGRNTFGRSTGRLRALIVHFNGLGRPGVDEQSGKDHYCGQQLARTAYCREPSEIAHRFHLCATYEGILV